MLTYSLFTRCLLLFCAVIINIVIFVASQDKVIDSLVCVVRTAVQRNATPQTTMQTADDADDFSAVLSATRAAMRRRRRNVPGKHSLFALHYYSYAQR